MTVDFSELFHDQHKLTSVVKSSVKSIVDNCQCQHKMFPDRIGINYDGGVSLMWDFGENHYAEIIIHKPNGASTYTLYKPGLFVSNDEHKVRAWIPKGLISHLPDLEK